VLVNGRKQGATKKTTHGASALCKKSLLDAFRRLRRPDDGDGATDVRRTYAQIKSDAAEYGRRWTAAKLRLGCWTTKPDGLLEFT